MPGRYFWLRLNGMRGGAVTTRESEPLEDFHTAASAADRAERRSGWALLAVTLACWALLAGMISIVWVLA